MDRNDSDKLIYRNEDKKPEENFEYDYNKKENCDDTTSSDTKEISIFRWFITIVLLAIPFINIVFFLYSVICDKYKSRRNFMVAFLIFIFIIYALVYFLNF